MPRMDDAIPAARPVGIDRGGATSARPGPGPGRDVKEGAQRTWLKSRFFLRGLRRIGRRCLLAASGCVIAFAAHADNQRGDPSALCEAAAHRAAQDHAIPPAVMLALTHVETGRADAAGQLRPWPWALNIAGQGVWLPTAQAAVARAREAIARGQTSVDLGCFQVNYRWHGQAFASLEAMIDPARNAAYAARFLRQQYERLGSWKLAAGAYHSQTEVHAAVYRARFEQALSRIGAAPQGAPAGDPAAPMRMAAPQLVAAGSWGPGSVLPRGVSGRSRPSETASAGAISMGMLR